MRVGDESAVKLVAMILKSLQPLSVTLFLWRMNVGEKRRSQLGSFDYAYDQKMASLRLSTVGAIIGGKSFWLSVCLYERSRTHFWFYNIEEN